MQGYEMQENKGRQGNWLEIETEKFFHFQR